MLQNARQGEMKIHAGLHRVVEGDNGAAGGIAQHAVAALVRLHTMVVILGHHIPQNHAVTLLAKRFNLLFGEPSVWRAHQVRINVLRCQINIVDILFGAHLPPVQVAVGVVANGVAFGKNAVVDFGVMVNVAAKAEERGFGVVFGQIVEHPFGDVGCWPVIEGEIQRFGRILNLPLEFREETADKLWRMVYYSNHDFQIIVLITSSVYCKSPILRRKFTSFSTASPRWLILFFSSIGISAKV